MAKYLLIIAALVIAGTAYLGYETNQQVIKVQTELKEKKDKLTATIADLTKTKATLEETKEKLVVANATIEEKEAEIQKKKGEIDGLNEKLTKADAEVKDLTAKMTSISDELAKLNTIGVQFDQIAGTIKKLTEEKTMLETQLAEAKQVSDTLNARLKEKEDKLAGSERQVAEYKTGFVRNGLSGTVLAYNPGWGFVLLSIGDKQGLKSNTPMVVTRGGQMVAKVRVSSVEPGRSIADVVPGSIARGGSIQPGDSVVFEGRENRAN